MKKTIQIPIPKFSFYKRRRFWLAMVLLGALGYWFWGERPYLRLNRARLAAPVVNLRAERMGRIALAGFEMGDPVTRGELVFAFATDEERAEQEKLQREIVSLETMVEGCAKTTQELLKEYYLLLGDADMGIVATEEVERSLSVLNEQEWQVKDYQRQMASAKDQLARVESAMAQKKTLAPMTGVVLKRVRQVGDMVQMGDVVYSLCDPSRLWVEAVVPEGAIRKVRVGQKAVVKMDVDGSLRHGAVSWISPVALPEGRGVPIRIEIEKIEGLRPNLSGRAKIRIR